MPMETLGPLAAYSVVYEIPNPFPGQANQILFYAAEFQSRGCS
jgi:hypothetical protein